MQKENKLDLIARLFKSPHLFLACGFGVGLIRPGPGTWGTLIAFPIHHALSPFFSQYALLVFWTGMFFLGIAVCTSSEKVLGESDHSAIVIDEFVAFGVILAFIPGHFYLHILAFVLFRIFDIVKPYYEEVLKWINETIKSSEHAHLIGKVLVFTGGASQIDGLSIFVNNMYNYNSRIGTAKNLRFNFHHIMDASQSVTAGLIQNELNLYSNKNINFFRGREKKLEGKINLSFIKQWVGENFF